MDDSVLIVGCGDVGSRVARLHLQRGERVSALARSEAAARRLREVRVRGDVGEPGAEYGVEPVAGDLDDPRLHLPDQRWRVIYHFAPPPARGVEDARSTHLATALGMLSQSPRRVVYVSTSGVYGDRGGAWVSEADEPDPGTDRARRRWHAETTLRAVLGERLVVLRVGGIYGPGRLPLARLERGEPILREAQCGYTNRIHVEDLARICVAAADHPRPHSLYNVGDGEPGTMSQYFKAVAARMGLPPPPEIDLAEAREQLSPAMLSYLLESRRMDTRRLRELGVTLRYPNLERGLSTVDLSETPKDGG